MKHIKLFETATAFEAARATLDLPNVSLIEATNGINYLPYVASDPSNGHEYVEIGGIKWATMNIGANSITDTGLYFQWGDTQGYTAESGKRFQWEYNGYKYSTSSSNMTKYNSTDELTALLSEDDAVTTAWGGNWRTPTPSECQALKDAVNIEWTTNYLDSGVKGFICTDKTDSSKVLFFPATGWCEGSNFYNTDECRCWSSSLLNTNVSKAYNMQLLYTSNVNYTSFVPKDSKYRYYGYSVRGVLDDSNS